MATPAEFRIFYTKLIRLYPGRYQDDDDTLDAWYSQLNDIPVEYLDATIPALADDKSVDIRFAPNAIQIRRIAKRLSGANEFEAVEHSGSWAGDEGQIGDRLRTRMYELMGQFWDDETLDAAEWQTLAREFRHRGRDHAAAHAEEVYKRLESLEG